MIGLLWNIRGLGKDGRIIALTSRVRDCHVDFLGILETKKNNVSPGLLKSITNGIPFNWYHLGAKGSAGRILVGTNADRFNMVVVEVLKFSVSVMLTSKSNGYVWKLIVVYGPAYEELKQEFLDELEVVMGS